jgi:hypothetical protein
MTPDLTRLTLVETAAVISVTYVTDPSIFA